MSGLPYLKFYPTDWQADEGVRMCSLAARGLWLEMLLIMHKNGGYLRVGGVTPTVTQLAHLLGVPAKSGPSSLANLLRILEESGVFSRTNDGTIFSRRMVRDLANGEKPDPTNAERQRRFREKKRTATLTDPPTNGADISNADRYENGRYDNAPLPDPTPKGSHPERSSRDDLPKDRDCKIARRADGPAILRDDDSAALDTLERKVMKLYDPPEAMRIITASHGDSVRNRWGYLGSFVAKAESQHPPPPKPTKADREREQRREAARALGLNV